MEQRRNDQDKFQPPRMKPPEMPNQNHNHQPPPPHKCPRCDSSNTKFCYYNNYSLSQPRYFCKACRRYWTHGGTLRNVPVGGGCRKSKRPKPSTPSPSSAEIGRTPPATAPLNSISGQVLRPLPPMMSSSMGNTFYSSGSFLSAMQSLSPAVSVGGQYDANIALLQSLKPQAQQFGQLQNNHYFPPQQNLRPSALTSWTQSFINNRGSGAGFWSGDGNNQAEAGSSFNPNDQWQDSNPGGFDDPSSNIP